MRVFKKIICLTWCFAIVNSLHAQQSNTKTEEKTSSNASYLGFKIGYDRSYLKDINLSPLNYKGNGNVIDFNFKRITKNRDIFFSNLAITSTTLVPNAPTPPSVNLSLDRSLINLEIGMLKNIKLNKKLQLHIGGGYHSYIDLSFYKGGESITFFATHGLDLSSQLSYQFHSKHKLEGSLSIPMISLLVRPPYTGWNKFVDESGVGEILTTGKWTSLNDLTGTNIRLNYTYSFAKRWSLETQYRLRVYSTKYLKQTKIATSQTSLGLDFKF